MKTISIIIPVYNVEHYLKDCLDSILVNNAFTGEVICVNDGSTDNSGNILAQYAERYNNLKIITQSNGGLSKARNTGLAVATGDYVLFLDSDDMLTSTALKSISKNISNEDILYFDVKEYIEHTKSFTKQEHRRLAHNISGKDYYSTYPTLEPPFWCVCVWGGGYRRKFLLDNNLWCQEGISHEDELFTPKALFYAKKISIIPEPLYIYRRHNGSITAHITPKNCRDHLFVANDLYRFFKEHEWLTAASKQSIWNNYYYAISKSLKCGLKPYRFFCHSDWKKMLQCSFNQRHRRTAILMLFSFRLGVRYYEYRTSRVVRKLINMLVK